ncbi:hypothetical protein HHI36_009526 [Cryptolaemus montrouzieri]|uniref:Uncharacterized protein n=1 Tax=Cryptolaemus montrouzieri TaxID=559131 RepID=A0ABD2MG03_9CUCU
MSLINEEEEIKVEETTENLEKETTSLSLSEKYYGDSIDFDSSSMRCFKQIELSSSSLFKHPLYFFPTLEDPGIFEAFRYEAPLRIDNDVGTERYIRMCKILEIVPLQRVLESLDRKELDLRYYALRPKELRAIFHVLEINAYIETLKLQDSWMEEESVRLLSDMLMQNGTITSLDLKQCKIGPQGAKALNDGLLVSLTLKELNLSYNSIGDQGLRYLKPTLKGNESIKKIDLGHNNLTSASASTLQQFLALNEVVENINLEWNALCNDDAIKKISNGLRQNTHLVSINFSWNALESLIVAKELGRFIKESNTLQFLDLSNNGFNGRAVMVLKHGIIESPSLKHIKMGYNPIGVVEAASFATILLQNTPLEVLELQNIYFEKSFNSTLKKIKKSGKKLIYGGVLGNFKIAHPSMKQVLLKRCHYLGLAPKKAKAKRDFGHIVLSLPDQPMNNADFETFVRKKKKGRMYDMDLLDEVRKVFTSGKTKVDTQSILSEYMKIYPDTTLPPPKPKKGKKGRGKKKAAPISSTTATLTATETDVDEQNVSSTAVVKLPTTTSFSSMGSSSSKQKIEKTASFQENRSMESAGSRQKIETKAEEIEPEAGVPVALKESVRSTDQVEKKGERAKSAVTIRDDVEVFEGKA